MPRRHHTTRAREPELAYQCSRGAVPVVSFHRIPLLEVEQEIMIQCAGAFAANRRDHLTSRKLEETVVALPVAHDSERSRRCGADGRDRRFWQHSACWILHMSACRAVCRGLGNGGERRKANRQNQMRIAPVKRLSIARKARISARGDRPERCAIHRGAPRLVNLFRRVRRCGKGLPPGPGPRSAERRYR
jgi:hypothetical protein